MTKNTATENQHNQEQLKQAIVNALQQVYDPEIPVNIYDLGLIYAIDINKENFVKVTMTLTTPGCPVAQTFPQLVQDKVLEVNGVSGAFVDLVWDPPWNQNMMTEEAKLQLGFL